MDRALRIPGITNAWTMPIKSRIDMLTTGIRTPIGIKIFGADLKEIERIGAAAGADRSAACPARAASLPSASAGGYFVDFDLKRDAAGPLRPVGIGEAKTVIMSAVGGENVTTTVEGRERYPVNVRYARELRDDLEQLCTRAGPDARRAPRSPWRRSPTSARSPARP